jgi:nitroimidazol reductase NimA-like FMN-containing flavoprotein (pyridoxamine 5'-phosphate oxidase superfamily)
MVERRPEVAKDPIDTASARPPQQVHRKDRAVEDEGWIREFLERTPFGALATVHEGQPFINSNLFVYDADAHAIYLHTARVGRTRKNVEGGVEGTDDGSGGTRACFSVSEMGRLLPADEALEFSVEYAGVAVFGEVTVVDDPVEAERGLQKLLDKYAPHLKPGRDYRGITQGELKRTSVFRLDVEGWSGKRKAVGEGFEGAYWYGEGG